VRVSVLSRIELIDTKSIFRMKRSGTELTLSQTLPRMSSTFDLRWSRSRVNVFFFWLVCLSLKSQRENYRE
jgi:hypothetical protein